MPTILTSSQQTFVDITDQRKLSAYITSNLPKTQSEDPNVLPHTYAPSWASTNLTLTPVVFLDQTNVALNASGLTITWKRKDGSGAETALNSNEKVTGGILKVNSNVLASSSTGMITYICYISYYDSETKNTVNITSDITYTLVRNAENAKLAYVTADTYVFKYNTSSALVGAYIQKSPDWEFAGIYADDGISGTNTKKREEFNRMIDDCKAGNIDMIITKSISRFARNTLDCLKYIRQLKDMNIPVLFEKESINTMDAKGEVLITIMASLAQQESQSLSQNVKMGLQYRYQQGKVQINHNRFLGYTKDADGNLVIDPEQAETVKRIYREYLEGLSMDKIAAGLERDGILTGAGGKKWHTSTINKILRNEKYIGDALLQKTYTTDFLNKTRVKNNGLVPQYYVEGDHEAIIPKDIYLQVQEELVRRRVVKTSANGKKRSYSCNHCFSQIVICGECGEMFRRLHWNNRGVKSIVWRCISRLESTGLECHARTINELLLQDVVVKAINQMLGDKSSYQAQLQLNIATVIRASQATAIDSIDEKLMALQQELIQKANSKEDYDEIADEIFRLRELRQKTTVDTAARDEQIKRINDLQDYISQQTTYLTEFDESLVRRWIKQITIWDDHITVELKSDVSIDVDA